MANNYGKQFENLVKAQFSLIPNAVIERLYDTTNGFKGITQPADFLAYVYPNFFYLEVKVIQTGNTFDLSRLTQYDKLVEKAGVRGVRAGVILWWVDKHKIAYVPVNTVKQLLADGKKSVNVKYLETNEYRLIEIPSKLKRVFMESDYSILTTLEEGD